MSDPQLESLVPSQERIIIPDPYRDIPPQVARLSTFVQQEIQEKVRGQIKMTGYWLPLYTNSPPERLIPYLHTAFTTLSKRGYSDVSQQPVFLDCGSGYGEIGMTASLAGYTSYNVEVLDRVNTHAVVLAKQAEEQGIIPREKVIPVAGSYYLPEYFQHVLEQFTQENNLDNPSEDDIFNTLSLLGSTAEELTHPTKAVLDQKLLDLEQKSQVFGSLPLFQKPVNDISLVFSFPSDVFMEYNNGFIQQWEDVLPPKSRLVFVANNEIVRRLLAEKKLQHFRYEGMISWEDQPELLVFQK